MKNNILRDKSYQFALRIVKTYQFICTEKQATSLLNDNDELLKIMGSIQKTMKSKIHNP